MIGSQPDFLPDDVNSLAVNDPTDRSSPASGLTRAEIREFQLLIEQSTGVHMEDATAWIRATQLVSVVRMLLGPIPEDPERPVTALAVQRHAPLAERAVDG